MIARPELRFRAGSLNLPERRERYNSSSRVGEEVDAQKCPGSKAVESRTHMVAECELFEKERGVFDALDSTGVGRQHSFHLI